MSKFQRKPPHLTQAETDRLLCYVPELMMAMKLSDQQVMLVFEQADDAEDRESVWASMNWSDHKRVGNLRVCSKWEALPDDVKTECIVHELLHLLLRDVDLTIEDLPVHYMPVTVHTSWHDRYIRDTENAVHHLTRLLMPTVPQWPGHQEHPDYERCYLQRVHD